MFKKNPNQLSNSSYLYLQSIDWENTQPFDLNAQGILYNDVDILPTQLSPELYIDYFTRGLVPPISLPIYVSREKDEEMNFIKNFLKENYKSLAQEGRMYIGENIYNVSENEDWDKAEMRIIIPRISSLESISTSFGAQTVSEFTQDFMGKKVFIDFTFLPDFNDIPTFLKAGVPLMFGLKSKRPLTDFDVIMIPTAYPAEVMNIPQMLTKSGIPLYRHQRFNDKLYPNMPLITFSGINSTVAAQTIIADNPRYGLGMNGMVDASLYGEGEAQQLNFCQHFINFKHDNNIGRDQKLTAEQKQAFLDSIDTNLCQGFVDYSRLMFEYADKHVQNKLDDGTIVDDYVIKGAGPLQAIYWVDPKTQTKILFAGGDSYQNVIHPHFKDMMVTQEALDKTLEQLQKDYPEYDPNTPENKKLNFSSKYNIEVLRKVKDKYIDFDKVKDFVGTYAVSAQFEENADH